MKTKKIVNNSTNRGEFNRAYKAHLENTGKIHCSRCKYHDNENKTTKSYGGYTRHNGKLPITYPNWKLVSKNRKQWMKKPMKINIEISRWSKHEFIDITW